MRALDSFDNIFLYRLPVDGRKQINGLSEIVKREMAQDPFCGALFVFISKSRDLLRVIYWDRSGFALWVKRLERERFRWPIKLEEDVVKLSSKELSWLLDGLDIVRMRPHATLCYSAL